MDKWSSPYGSSGLNKGPAQRAPKRQSDRSTIQPPTTQPRQLSQKQIKLQMNQSHE